MSELKFNVGPISRKISPTKPPRLKSPDQPLPFELPRDVIVTRNATHGTAIVWCQQEVPASQMKRMWEVLGSRVRDELRTVQSADPSLWIDLINLVNLGKAERIKL